MPMKRAVIIMFMFLGLCLVSEAGTYYPYRPLVLNPYNYPYHPRRPVVLDPHTYPYRSVCLGQFYLDRVGRVRCRMRIR